jgi:hypothetical protein
MSLLDKDDDHIEIDENKDYLSELVGDGKKFKSEKDLARGKYESDLMIETMKRRMDEMREDFLKAQDELKTRASIEEMLDRIASKGQPDNRDDNHMRKEDEKPVLDPAKLDSLFDEKIISWEARKKAEANRKEVESKLREQYGNDYKTVLSKQVNELGLSVEEMDAMAAKSPKAFFRTFGLDRPAGESYDAPPRSNQRSTFAPDTGEKRTWSFYKKMRQEKPDLYFSAKIHNQMLKDMEVLGDKFKDGDFNQY